MIEQYHIHFGDCIPHMHDMDRHSMDFAIFSPPFPSLYAYTSEDCDIGNTATVNEEAKLHLSFFYRALAKVVKPGRVIIVHVCQIPRMKRCGQVGLCDFRGMNIALAERAGLIHEYDWTVTKNPQSQAIRTKSRELQFSGLEADRAKSRGALSDYLIKLVVPGENAIAVDSTGEVSRNDWIAWAEGCWSWHDISETDTLNTAAAKSEDDTRHICPLQLEIYRRCILLYTNPDEVVFEPFAGIGSGGYVALGGTSVKTGKRIDMQRRYYGCEIKKEYYDQAIVNIESAIEHRAALAKERMLF